jgi:hypothetical protein
MGWQQLDGSCAEGDCENEVWAELVRKCPMAMDDARKLCLGFCKQDVGWLVTTFRLLTPSQSCKNYTQTVSTPCFTLHLT